MAIDGTVQVTGPIAPSLVTDDYPTHESIYGRGGYREVADITARDAIPSERQRVGMLVWVADRGDGSPETYILDVIGDPGTYSVAFASLTGEWADGVTHIYPADGVSKQVVVGQLTAPSDPNAIMQVSNGNFQIGGTWNGGHFVMGIAPNDYHIWIDAAGAARIKNGAPVSDLDGDIIGTQS